MRADTDTPVPWLGKRLRRDRPLSPERRSRPVEHAGGHGPSSELHGHRHRDIQGGWARAAVFGVSDGLVTNVSLILGMAGAHPGPTVVRLAGVAGLVAGCWSMAMGEYVSMRAQRELLERELAKEREEIQRRPEGERHELIHIYESRGVDPAAARELATAMMRTPELALQTHAREELGVDPSELGSPFAAGISSFVTFGVGALLPLLPWFATAGSLAVVLSVVIGGVASLVVGGALAVFTERSWWWSALRQLLLAAVAAGVTYGIGAAIGVAVPST
ncbi:VIT1/CCC1 transporter family protein [Aciditerrimonas ferrireducens]|nr:VIT1/CCC1 transporter family protein [Aciditerrimonas ferrireducens]MCK4177184.1 VIT1/CCC1 transporter family protein [Aciditerrimonas ferrireducens]